MINTQRIIKYVAIGLALLLTVNIISAIMYGIISIGTVFTFNNDKDYIKEGLENIPVSENIEVLDIDIASSNITIKEGSTVKIETNNKYIKTKENNHKLTITEEKHNWLNINNTSDLIIYLPLNYLFNNVSIENGAGKIDIESLNTERLNLDLGAGKVNINNLTVLKDTEIDGGAGEINITNGNLTNLDLDMGVGKLTLTATINENSKIDAGVGALDLNLIGTIDDYKIILDKGLGNATLDGEKMKNSTYYGNGSKLIDIDGGIGAIKIDFIDK